MAMKRAVGPYFLRKVKTEPGESGNVMCLRSQTVLNRPAPAILGYNLRPRIVPKIENEDEGCLEGISVSNLKQKRKIIEPRDSTAIEESADTYCLRGRFVPKVEMENQVKRPRRESEEHFKTLTTESPSTHIDEDLLFIEEIPKRIVLGTFEVNSEDSCIYIDSSEGQIRKEKAQKIEDISAESTSPDSNHATNALSLSDNIVDQDNHYSSGLEFVGLPFNDLNTSRVIEIETVRESGAVKTSTSSIHHEATCDEIIFTSEQFSNKVHDSVQQITVHLDNDYPGKLINYSPPLLCIDNILNSILKRVFEKVESKGEDNHVSLAGTRDFATNEENIEDLDEILKVIEFPSTIEPDVLKTPKAVMLTPSLTKTGSNYKLKMARNFDVDCKGSPADEITYSAHLHDSEFDLLTEMITGEPHSSHAFTNHNLTKLASSPEKYVEEIIGIQLDSRECPGLFLEKTQNFAENPSLQPPEIADNCAMPHSTVECNYSENFSRNNQLLCEVNPSVPLTRESLSNPLLDDSTGPASPPFRSPFTLFSNNPQPLDDLTVKKGNITNTAMNDEKSLMLANLDTFVDRKNNRVNDSVVPDLTTNDYALSENGFLNIEDHRKLLFSPINHIDLLEQTVTGSTTNELCVDYLVPDLSNQKCNEQNAINFEGLNEELNDFSSSCPSVAGLNLSASGSFLPSHNVGDDMVPTVLPSFRSAFAGAFRSLHALEDDILCDAFLENKAVGLDTTPQKSQSSSEEPLILNIGEITPCVSPIPEEIENSIYWSPTVRYLDLKPFQKFFNMKKVSQSQDPELEYLMQISRCDAIDKVISAEYKERQNLGLVPPDPEWLLQIMKTNRTLSSGKNGRKSGGRSSVKRSLEFCYPSSPSNRRVHGAVKEKKASHRGRSCRKTSSKTFLKSDISTIADEPGVSKEAESQEGTKNRFEEVITVENDSNVLAAQCEEFSRSQTKIDFVENLNEEMKSLVMDCFTASTIPNIYEGTQQYSSFSFEEDVPQELKTAMLETIVLENSKRWINFLESLCELLEVNILDGLDDLEMIHIVVKSVFNVWKPNGIYRKCLNFIRLWNSYFNLSVSSDLLPETFLKNAKLMKALLVKTNPWEIDAFVEYIRRNSEKIWKSATENVNDAGLGHLIDAFKRETAKIVQPQPLSTYDERAPIENETEKSEVSSILHNLRTVRDILYTRSDAMWENEAMDVDAVTEDAPELCLSDGTLSLNMAEFSNEVPSSPNLELGGCDKLEFPVDMKPLEMLEVAMNVDDGKPAEEACAELEHLVQELRVEALWLDLHSLLRHFFHEDVMDLSSGAMILKHICNIPLDPNLILRYPAVIATLIAIGEGEDEKTRGIALHILRRTCGALGVKQQGGLQLIRHIVLRSVLDELLRLERKD